MEATIIHSKSSSEQPLWQQRLLLAHSPLTLISTESPQRSLVERFIAREFMTRYNASLQVYLPFLLASFQNEEVNAALGFKLAAEEPLFLEQYLDKPIERSLPANTNSITREQIAEVGNLAMSFRAVSPLLFIVVAAILHKAGLSYVVFTATTQVRKLLEKLQLVTDVIGPADPSRLADKGQSWGSYYQHQPIILGGWLNEAVNHLRKHEVIRAALNHHADFINETAARVRNA